MSLSFTGGVKRRRHSIWQHLGYFNDYV